MLEWLLPRYVRLYIITGGDGAFGLRVESRATNFVSSITSLLTHLLKAVFLFLASAHFLNCKRRVVDGPSVQQVGATPRQPASSEMEIKGILYSVSKYNDMKLKCC